MLNFLAKLKNSFLPIFQYKLGSGQNIGVQKTRGTRHFAQFAIYSPISTGPVGARGEKIPSYKMMIDFSPNGSKSPGNGRILIIKYAKCLVPRIFFLIPIFDLYPNYRGKWAKMSF